MRWIRKIMWLLGAAALATGCTQQCFITEADYEHYHQLMPASLENDPAASLPPATVTTTKAVTILDPEKREPWYLTLQEAIALSLEGGSTGVQSITQPGRIIEDLVSPNQFAQIEQASDALRVLSINPAIAGAGIEASIARFDTRWVSSLGWNFVDQQVQGLGSFQNGENATLRTTLAKPLITGGVAGITFSTQYSNLAQPPQFFQIQNPAYTTRLDFTFDHPLWQSNGVGINQLLTRIPGLSGLSNLAPEAQALLNNINTNGLGLGSGFGTNGILIARLRFDQSRAEFEKIMNHRVLNVEAAYWNLYASYVNFYAAEQGLRLALTFWTEKKRQVDVGKIDPYILAQARGQYEDFRANRIQALQQVLENERILRRLLGLPIEDGKQLIPIDTPTLAPYYPDQATAVEEAINRRPELVAAREELKLRQLDLIVQKNFLKPDLRFTGRYGLTGLGSRLDGDGSVFDQSTQQFRSNNAFRNLAGGDFTDWNLGLTLNIPLGYRFEHAAVRRARLSLAQTYMALKNEEEKAEYQVVKAIRNIIENYRLIEARRAQRIAAATELEIRQRRIRVGVETAGGEFYLDAQRRFTTALSQEYQAIAAYNTALAAFQFTKGTILQHNNIDISEGPLPYCAQVRAVEHERERSKALLIREREHPVPHVLFSEEYKVGVPALPDGVAPSIPALMQGANSPIPEEKLKAGDKSLNVNGLTSTGKSKEESAIIKLWGDQSPSKAGINDSSTSITTPAAKTSSVYSPRGTMTGGSTSTVIPASNPRSGSQPSRPSAALPMAPKSNGVYSTTGNQQTPRMLPVESKAPTKSPNAVESTNKVRTTIPTTLPDFSDSSSEPLPWDPASTARYATQRSLLQNTPPAPIVVQPLYGTLPETTYPSGSVEHDR